MLQSDAHKLGTLHQWNIRVMTFQEVADFWPQIEEELDARPELWNTHYTKESIFEQIADQRMFIIGCAKDEVVVLLAMCSVVDWPAARRLQVFWMAGEGLEEAGVILNMAIENFANIVGAQFIDGYGRKGWERFTKRFGYEFVRVQVSKAVTGTRQ
jgi:hypothetical protein